jgi:hypothetical protein
MRHELGKEDCGSEVQLFGYAFSRSSVRPLHRGREASRTGATMVVHHDGKEGGRGEQIRKRCLPEGAVLETMSKLNVVTKGMRKLLLCGR